MYKALSVTLARWLDHFLAQSFGVSTFWLLPNMISIQKKPVRSSLSESKGSCSNQRGICAQILEVWVFEASPRSEKPQETTWFQWNFMSFQAKKSPIKWTRISWNKNHGFFSGRSGGWGVSIQFISKLLGKPPMSPLISSSASNCELIPEPLQLHHSRPQPGGGAGCRWWFPNWGVYWVKKDTLPETNITPENDGFQ